MKMTDSFKSLFDIDEDEVNDPRKEWVHMPEFIQDKDEPFQKIIVRFASQEDVDEFAKLIGQPISPKTTSIWHPRLEHGKNAGLRWIEFDDDEELLQIEDYEGLEDE